MFLGVRIKAEVTCSSFHRCPEAQISRGPRKCTTFSSRNRLRLANPNYQTQLLSSATLETRYNKIITTFCLNFDEKSYMESTQSPAVFG